MKNAGHITRAVLDAMKPAVRPGITTQQLNQVARRAREAPGALSPMLVYGLPGYNCISVKARWCTALRGIAS